MCTEPSIKADEPVGRLEGPDDRQPGGGFFFGGGGGRHNTQRQVRQLSASRPPILKCVLSASSESWCGVSVVLLQDLGAVLFGNVQAVICRALQAAGPLYALSAVLGQWCCELEYDRRKCRI